MEFIGITSTDHMGYSNSITSCLKSANSSYETLDYKKENIIELSKDIQAQFFNYSSQLSLGQGLKH